jgi:hypothetical protein
MDDVPFLGVSGTGFPTEGRETKKCFDGVNAVHLALMLARTRQ